LSVRAGLVLVAHLIAFGCVQAQQRDDEELASRISRAILASDELNLSRIDVTAEKGTVYLSGMADDHESKAHAETEARNIRGVRKVINKIEVDF
jgi:hyperosmotically inducible periplasmic protein